MIKALVRSSMVASVISLAVCLASTAVAAVGDDAPTDLSPRDAAAVDIAQRYVSERLDEMGLAPDDVSDLAVSDVYTSRHTEVTHVYFMQRYKGIDLHNALINVNVLPSGEVLHSGNRAFGQLSRRKLAVEPRITALTAVNRAARAAGLDSAEPFIQLQQSAGPDRRIVFSDGGISLEPIPARLVYADDDKGRLRLAWLVEIYERSAQHYWLTFVDAETGDTIDRRDLVIHDRWGDGHSGRERSDSPRTDASPARAGGGHAVVMSAADGSEYRVFEMPKEHPNDGPRTLVGEPAYEPASPFGWHDTDGAVGAEYTITRGNNAHAYQDRNNSNSSAGDEPDGGASLSFDFALDLNQGPEQYIDAAVTNLFYWSSLHHDLAYVRGFDEAAGNFQANNYGNGGAGNDPVRSEAQDGADVGNSNNANFFTPSDGSAPRMQMYIWTTTTPNRDGDLDAGIVLHEYGHGISNRQTGGPSQVGCLSNDEQAGEGWSDWQTLIYTAKAGHTATTNRGVGTYALGQAIDGPGIRAFPYNTDMSVDPRTYADTQGAAIPHGVGSIWTAMLWEVYWNLVDEYGFNPDFYADWDQGGNLLAMQLVNDGLKLQPCSPGFVDGRDAILAADQALTGGANQCLIWEGFAKRGLGFSATQGDTNSNADNTEAFDMPAACAFGEVTPPEQMACTGDSVDYEISLGAAWSAPVNLSVSGHPGSATFGQNPVSAPGTSTLTIDSTAGEAAGLYNMIVEGADGSEAEQFPIALELFEQAPGGAILDTPTDGAGNVAFRPTLSWLATDGAASYQVEIATDAGFSNVVHSAEVEGNSYTLSSSLPADTMHYWRVYALNPCGTGAMSSTFSFTTATSSLVCGGSEDFESGIPGDWTITDDSPSGNGITWATTADDQCGIGNNTGASGIAACADSDHPGSGNSPAYDTSLVTPPLDLSGFTSATLDVSAYFRYFNVSQFNIEVWNGSGWDVAWTVGATSQDDVSVDLDSYTGQNDVEVRFRYLGDGWDYYSQVDDIALSCTGVAVHAVTAAVGGGQGSITPASQPVDHGDSANFTVTPDAGWSVNSVTGDTCSPIDTGGGVWTANDITADCAVSADFQINSYTVTAATGSGQGSITPASQAVDHEGSASFIVTPDAGWSVSSVAGDTCSPVDAGSGTWTADNITAGCAVTADFQLNSYTVTPSAGVGGSIAPPTPQAIDHGQNLQFTVTADGGHRIDSVGGSCGGSLVGNVYTTDSVSGDCTVDATFEVLVDEMFEDRFEGQVP